MPFEAVLFDLDGTLLDYSLMDDLLPHYLAAMGARMRDLVKPDALVAGIMHGSEAITANDGTRTNEDVFMEAFFTMIDAPRATLLARFDDFYREDFPRLQEHVRQRPAARRAVQAAFDAGGDVVIATNPYFPASAVQERLRWAGVADFPYAKVTTYENSHFAKPNLDYFREILDELGVAPEAALVVGDEAMDMVAGHLGCTTYLVPSGATKRETIAPEPTHEGSLEGLVRLLTL